MSVLERREALKERLKAKKTKASGKHDSEGKPSTLGKPDLSEKEKTSKKSETPEKPKSPNDPKSAAKDDSASKGKTTKQSELPEKPKSPKAPKEEDASKDKTKGSSGKPAAPATEEPEVEKPEDEKAKDETLGDEKPGSEEPEYVKPDPPPRGKNGNLLIKQDGRLIENGKKVMPDNTNDGQPNNLWPDLPRDYSRGLDNPGNFCYRVSTFQALLHIPGIYRYLGTLHRDCDRIFYNCVVCALQALAYWYWNEDISEEDWDGEVSVVLNQLWLACRSTPPKDNPVLLEEFERKAQSDAVEFLHYLLEQIRAEAIMKEDKVAFAQVFDMLLKDIWTCQECGTSTSRDLGKNDVTSMSAIDLQTLKPKNRNLDEYIQHELERKLNKYCDHGQCGIKYLSELRKLVDGPERDWRRLFELGPAILFLKLEVFHHITGKDGKHVMDRNGRITQRKASNKMQFDELLDLSNYTLDDSPLVYRLDSVIAHSGNSPNSGHYIAAVRAKEPDLAQLISINDAVRQGTSVVGAGQFDEMQTSRSGGNEFDPYILCYSKIEE